jgi:hypothetical protein
MTQLGSAIGSTANVESTPHREQLATIGLLEPWALLPSQMAGGSTTALSGEKRLMAAVLADAIHLYLGRARWRNGRHQVDFREAATWIESEDRTSLLAFENVCDVLQLDAGRVRRALRMHAASGIVHAIPFDVGRLRVARRRKIRV